MTTIVYVVFFRKREGNKRRKERERKDKTTERETGSEETGSESLRLVFLLRKEKNMMMANDLSSVTRVCQRTLNKHR